MTALQRLGAALEVEASHSRFLGRFILEDTRWHRTFDAAEIRNIAALMLKAADELDAAQAAEVQP